MTIEDRLALREENMQNARVEENNTFFKNVLRMGIVNPLIDSTVVNASEKGTGVTFKGALKTGVYNNYTMMGGNFIFGSSIVDKVPYVGNKFEAWKNQDLGKSYAARNKKWTINFLSERGQKKMGVTDRYLKRAGIGNADHVIETGFGFSRNYRPFFETLEEQGLGKQAKPVRVKQVASAVTPTNVASIADEAVVTTTEVAKKAEIDGKTVKRLYDKLEIPETKNTVNSILKSKDAGKIKDLFVEHLSKRNGKNASEIAGTLKQIGIKVPIEDVARVTRQEIDDMAGAITKKFFVKSTYEKVMSSPFMQLATGNLVSGKLSFGVNAITSVISGMATSHTEAAVQNVANSYAYSYVKGGDVYSEQGLSTTQKHASYSQMNDRDLAYVLSRQNIAKDHRRDINPIEIDESAGKKESFTIY
jgi:hypothetical protein